MNHQQGRNAPEREVSKITLHHINRNGRVSRCNANANRCQFGDASLHSNRIGALRAIIDAANAAGRSHLLLGTKTNIAALLPSGQPAPAARPTSSLPSSEIVPVTGAVASRRWETSGIFSVKISFVCGSCSGISKKCNTYTVISSGTPYIAAICEHCVTRNIFLVPLNGRRGWLVRNA